MNKLNLVFKMKNIFILLSFIIALLLYIGCSKDSGSDCTETPVASTYEPLYVKDGTREYWLKRNDTTKVVNYTIKSETDYKMYVTGSLKKTDDVTDSLPSIDFTKKSLIAGQYISEYADRVISMSIEKACDTYTLTVDVGGGARKQTTKVYFFAVVEVTGSDATVKVVSEH
jgi:hypothetical protein